MERYIITCPSDGFGPDRYVRRGAVQWDGGAGRFGDWRVVQPSYQALTEDAYAAERFTASEVGATIAAAERAWPGVELRAEEWK